MQSQPSWEYNSHPEFNKSMVADSYRPMSSHFGLAVVLGLFALSALTGCAGPNYEAHRFMDPDHLPASAPNTGCPDNRTIQVQRTDVAVIEKITFNGGIAPQQCLVVVEVDGKREALIAPGGIVFPGHFLNSQEMGSAFFDVQNRRKTKAYFTASLNTAGFGTTNTLAELNDKGDEIISINGERKTIHKIELVGRGNSKNTKYLISYIEIDGTFLPISVVSAYHNGAMATYELQR